MLLKVRHWRTLVSMKYQPQIAPPYKGMNIHPRRAEMMAKIAAHPQRKAVPAKAFHRIGNDGRPFDSNKRM
jgi:hypothetical protein